MILQALTNYYSVLTEKGKVPQYGLSPTRVTYALYLNDDGSLQQVIDVKTEQKVGNKVKYLPQEMNLPSPVVRTIGKKSNFLWDNAKYILGIGKDEEFENSSECFKVCKALHENLLSNIDSPAAKVLLNYFETWKPEEAKNHPALEGVYDEISKGGNVVFLYRKGYIHSDEKVLDAWYNEFSKGNDNDQEMTCLITGEQTQIEKTHPKIQGVNGANSSGANLISFNKESFRSYGKEQNLNAPVGKYATYAYTSALNYLLSNRRYVNVVGDTTIVYWSKGGETASQALFSFNLFGDEDEYYSEVDLRNMMTDICQGKIVNYQESMIDPSMEFYILGLSPNNARLSVRFFLKNSFGTIMKNVQEHQERLKIDGLNENLPLWKLLDETINQKAKEKLNPKLSGDILRAILNGDRYPATLLNGVMIRIRADRDISTRKAAILKAYYLRNTNDDVPKEVLTMSLNTQSTNVPYLLGRLFEILEEIQSATNRNINATIKDRYFNSASSRPATVFPTMINLAQSHLKKLSDGQRIYYENKMMEIIDKLDEEFPDRLTVTQQGSFQLGYYHQKQLRYKKNKEEN